MKPGETRRARSRAGDHDQTQGSLDGILAPDEPQMPKRKQPRKRVETAGEVGVETLKSSLDTLEENIKLLLARHERLAAAHAASEELSRSRRALDPIELQSRVRSLEAERQRLERHAAFLEERIRGLLSRVRYVIES